MDPRRFVILAAVGLWPAVGIPASAAIGAEPSSSTISPAPGAPGSLARPVEADPLSITRPGPERSDPGGAQSLPQARPSATARPYLSVIAGPREPGSGRIGAGPNPDPSERRRALGQAHAAARAVSSEDRFEGGVRVFAWAPGRVYEIWAAPLRVTTLTLSPGEVLIDRAAGDTVRWQVGQATSGAGAEVRTHVLLKPLQSHLATNLILTTNRRIYLIELRSAGSEAFNTAARWEPEVLPVEPPREPVEVSLPPPLIDPEAMIEAGYRIEPQGARQPWTPTSVFNDGRRTFITFAPDMQFNEGPALFVIGQDGERQLVNYRQVGGLFIVDQVLERAELRLGDRRHQAVRIHRTGTRP